MFRLSYLLQDERRPFNVSTSSTTVHVYFILFGPLEPSSPLWLTQLCLASHKMDIGITCRARSDAAFSGV